MRDVVVGLPETLGERLAACMPQEATVVAVADEGPLPDRFQEIEFLVPTFNRQRVTDLLPRLRQLKVLQTMSAGVDWLLSIAPEGVTICDASGVHDIPVSEWIVTAMLSVYKEFPVFRDSQDEGVWQRPTMFEPAITDMSGKKVLILGYGSIGRATEERLAPFGVEILRVARQARTGVHGIEQLPELLPRSDAVVLLLPLTDETRGIVDASFLARMKEGALLVNAARGPLVKTDALLESLQSGRVRAALDVTDPEPLPDGHELWTAPNTLITPHIAGHSPEFIARAGRFIGDQVGRYGRGEDLENVVQNGY